jgi:flagellar assembly factor FliW
MKIDSPRFGSLEVAPNKLIEFPGGIPGFESCKKFTLVEVESTHQAAVLQSADDPSVAFSVTTPELLGLHYEFTLTEEEETLLAVGKPEDISVLLILRHEDGADAASPVKANLMAPLVINTATRRGLQKVIARLGCDVTLRQE